MKSFGKKNLLLQAINSNLLHTDAAVNPSKQGSEALSSQLFSRSESISPVPVRPFSKAQPRSNNKRKRSRKGKSEILTDTPVKTAIAQAKSSKKVRLPKNTRDNLFYKNSSPTRQKEKRNLTALAKQEWYCLVCMDSYFNSKSKEIWVQCFSCKNWAHKKCISFSQSYVYHNCDADEEPKRNQYIDATCSR